MELMPIHIVTEWGRGWLQFSSRLSYTDIFAYLSHPPVVGFVPVVCPQASRSYELYGVVFCRGKLPRITGVCGKLPQKKAQNRF